MFSGIIRSVQPIVALSKKQGNLIVAIKKPTKFKLKIGDSVCVNGVCSTITKQTEKLFYVEYMPVTLKCTNASRFRINQKVNLETSLKLSDFVNGHFVLGHVDGIGIVKKILNKNSSIIFKVKYPQQFDKLIVTKGSIAVNGIALTISNNKKGFFSVAIIPHTLKNTNLQYLRKEDKVNLEFDIIGKYVQKNLSC